VADREPKNKNRTDLYRRLIPKIVEMDQASGAQGYIAHWDDPDATWDTAGLEDVLQHSWDAIGFSPVIQELCHVIEKATDEDLEVLESLDALVDPVRCPESVLPQLAASFGYRLDESQSEDRKRVALLGLIDAFRARGTFVGFRVFYRLLGFRIINVFPLWKKEIHEALNDYSRTRYDTTAITNDPIGPGGSAGYAGRLKDAPIVPGSVRISDGTITLRDDPTVLPENVNDLRGVGNLIGPGGESGTVRYATGEFSFALDAVAAGAVTADYERVDEEWPFHAARIDVDINISPGGVPIPLIDTEIVDEILTRMEEVRPVHVVLRALALVAEIVDQGPGATDQVGCTAMLKDVLTGQTGPPAILGRDRTYMLDAGPIGSDEMRITIDNLVGDDMEIQSMEDNAPIVCPLDTLTITGPPGGPFYV
jgi:hypothetical protein